MIILSQDKDVIINFDNIVNLVVIQNTIVSISDVKKTTGITIAEYGTEERAKEVLQEIISKYSSYLELKGGPAMLQGQMDIQPNIFNIPKVYEMPKE